MKTKLQARHTFLPLIFTFALYAPNVLAQQEIPVSGLLLEEGIKAYDTGNYKRAIELYKRVPEGDTGYTNIQYELALSYSANEEYQMAINTARKAMELPDAGKRMFLITIANALDYLDKKDSAIYYYKKVMDLNPNDHQPYFETGIVYFRKKEYDSAIKYLQQSLLINPTHFNSHQALGAVYGLQGRMTEAWICLQASLLYANDYKTAEKPIDYLTSIYKQTDQFSEAYTNKNEKYAHPVYDEIDAIIHAKLILNPEYKIKSVLAEEAHAKVSYAILEKLRYEKDDNNFVMQFYVPLLMELKEKDMTDNYLLQLYSGYGIEKIEKIVKREKKDIEKLRDLVYAYFSKILATRTLNATQRATAPMHYRYLISEAIYYDGKLKSLTEFDDGPITLYKNGVLAARGAFTAKNEKNGIWEYFYENGNLKSRESLKEGKLQGEYRSWHENGQLSSITQYDASGTSTSLKEYNTFGEPTEEYNVLADKSVQHISYYNDGVKKEISVSTQKDYVDGAYESWHSNGKPDRHYEIKKGELNGPAKEYYDNGKPEEEYNYEDGKLSGSYKVYHLNGKTALLTNYKAGELDGLLEKWNDDGKPVAKETYKNGKLEGPKYYFDEGVEYGSVTYADDKPVSYEFRDISGKPVALDKGPLKTLKLYYSNGNLKSTFPLTGSGINGTGKYYYYGGPQQEEVPFHNNRKNGASAGLYNLGNKSFDIHYKENLLDGYARYYHNNGKTSSEGFFVDDMKQGEWTFYNANEKMDKKMFFSEGNANGFIEEYNINGELISKDCYFENTIYRLVQYDSNGKEFARTDFKNGTGKYELINPATNKVWFSGTLQNGQLHGPYQKLFPDGKPYETGRYELGSREGMVYSYNINGVRTFACNYHEGKIEDSCVFYNDVNGAVNSFINYRNNELFGKRLSYDNNELRFESNFENGHRVGEQFIYGEGKQLAVVLYYSEGILMSYSYEGADGKLVPKTDLPNGSGDVKAFYKNGKKSVSLHYTQSNLDGLQQYYFANGNLYEEANFKNTDYHGAYKTYYANGKLKVEANYVDDEYHGAYKEYDEAGNIILNKNYFYGQTHGPVEILNPKTKSVSKMLYRYGFPVKAL